MINAADKQALKKGDKVSVGDRLMTPEGTFVQIKFFDQGEMIMRPGTEVLIKDYNFEEVNPQADKAEFILAKGGLRRLTGLIGKRGDKSADQFKTPTSTVGIRGTVYEAMVCSQGAIGCEKLDPGEYFACKSGVIEISNAYGSVELKAGQFAESKKEPPKILDNDPGIPPMNPPKTAALSNSTECSADANEADANEADANEADANEGDANEADANEADANEGDANEGDQADQQARLYNLPPLTFLTSHAAQLNAYFN